MAAQMLRTDWKKGGNGLLWDRAFSLEGIDGEGRWVCRIGGLCGVVLVVCVGVVWLVEGVVIDRAGWESPVRMSLIRFVNKPAFDGEVLCEELGFGLHVWSFGLGEGGELMGAGGDIRCAGLARIASPHSWPKVPGFLALGVRRQSCSVV